MFLEEKFPPVAALLSHPTALTLLLPFKPLSAARTRTPRTPTTWSYFEPPTQGELYSVCVCVWIMYPNVSACVHMPISL